MGRKRKIVDETKNQDYMQLMRKIYEQEQSLTKTAVRFQKETGEKMAYQKVRKILITLEVYEDERSGMIREYAETGMTAQEIAEWIGLSPVVVNSYMPYTKGVYNRPVRTMNAKRVERWRGKKKWD